MAKRRLTNKVIQAFYKTGKSVGPKDFDAMERALESVAKGLWELAKKK